MDWLSKQLVAEYELPTEPRFNGRLRLPLDTRAKVTLEARLLNVFNNQARLSTDSQQYLDLQTLPTAPDFAPYQQLNPFFATGNGFAPPRRLHIAAVVSF